jgi:hypothetical protein
VCVGVKVFLVCFVFLCMAEPEYFSNTYTHTHTYTHTLSLSLWCRYMPTSAERDNKARVAAAAEALAFGAGRSGLSNNGDPTFVGVAHAPSSPET